MNAENTAMTPAAENAVVETATESIGTRFTKKVLAQFASNTGSQIGALGVVDDGIAILPEDMGYQVLGGGFSVGAGQADDGEGKL